MLPEQSHLPASLTTGPGHRGPKAAGARVPWDPLSRAPPQPDSPAPERLPALSGGGRSTGTTRRLAEARFPRKGGWHEAAQIRLRLHCIQSAEMTELSPQAGEAPLCTCCGLVPLRGRRGRLPGESQGSDSWNPVGLSPPPSASCRPGPRAPLVGRVSTVGDLVLWLGRAEPPPPPKHDRKTQSHSWATGDRVTVQSGCFPVGPEAVWERTTVCLCWDRK